MKKKVSKAGNRTSTSSSSSSGLRREIKELRIRLEEAEDTLRAIREGEVDAVVVSGTSGEQIFSLVGADSIYRLIVETMKEAAFTTTLEGTILFCNAQFSTFVKWPLEQISGRPLSEFIQADNRPLASSLLITAQTQPVSRRLVFQGSDGAGLPAHVSANVLNQPDGLSICVVASDLTELENSTELIQQLRRQQEALQASNEELAATEEELRVQNEELSVSRTELDQSRLRYQDLFETAPDGYIVTDSEGIIQDMNAAAVHLLGCTFSDIRGNPFTALLPLTERESYLRVLSSLDAAPSPQSKWEVEIRPLKGPRFWSQISVSASRDEEGHIVGLRWLVRDITDSKRFEQEREARLTILRLANENKTIPDLVHAAVEFFQGQSGCEAVGIRLKEGDDYPYYESHGLPRDFVLSDNHLCLRDEKGCAIRSSDGNPFLECLCGDVINQQFDASKPFFTNGGSFWTNSITDLSASTSQANLPMPSQNRCTRQGYESMALIPLSTGQERLGLVQFNDHRKGMFSLETIRFWERLLDSLAVALSKLRTEKSLRANEEKFRSIFENSLDAIFLTHPDGRVTDVNPAACRMFGKTKEEICQAGRQAILSVDGHELTAPLEERTETSQMSRERTFLRADGSSLHTDMSSVIIPDEDGPRSFVILHDITNRKTTEKRLRQATDELARSNRDLESFAHVASHDLQEPLRMVSSFLTLLQEKYKDQLDDTARDYIGFSVEGSVRMASLIHDLLDYARVNTKGKEPVPVDLNLVGEEVKANLRASIDESNTLITVDPLPTIQADAAQMRQLFQNLIGNAIKFRVKGGHPEIFIGASRQNHEWVFQIKDNGIGIDPSQFDRIFQVFQRLHGRDEYTGTGIGLAICKKIVERHGGRIWVESEPGKGTTFWFSLPDR